MKLSSSWAKPADTVPLFQQAQSEAPVLEMQARVSESAPPPLDEDRDIPLAVLERLASAARPDQQVKLYRWAGDRYLQEENDLNSALRCYRKALDVGNQADWLVQAQDSWLLIALKTARQEDAQNVHRGS